MANTWMMLGHFLVLWMEHLCPPQSYIEALIRNVMAFVGGTFGR